MKKENDKFVILMPQNVGKSHFCKPCHMLCGVLLTMLGFDQAMPLLPFAQRGKSVPNILCFDCAIIKKHPSQHSNV